MSLETVIDEVEKLSADERRALMDVLRQMDVIKRIKESENNEYWAEFVEEIYACQAEDPIVRPEQPPLEIRNALD